MVSQMADFNSSRAFTPPARRPSPEAGITHKDVDHLMIYDAFAHLPHLRPGGPRLRRARRRGKFIADGNTRPGGKLPLNTNGGGLSYSHSGMYGMYALQESVRQMRGTAPAQVEGAKISVCHGVGGMFMASGTIIFTEREMSALPTSPSPRPYGERVGVRGCFHKLGLAGESPPHLDRICDAT